MKLDPRIIEGKKPLTPFDTEEAKKFIGKECYFACGFTDYFCISNLRKGILTCIDDEPKPFKSYSTNGSGRELVADFILPLEWTKREKQEPKWKPYDLESWGKHYDIGDAVEYRRKDCYDKEIENIKCVMYLGHTDYVNSGKILVLLGDVWHSFEELLENYEIHDYRYNNNHRVEWRPFGCRE